MIGERTVIVILVLVIILLLANILLKLFEKSDGVLKIDHSNPNKDIYRFVLNNDLESLDDKERIILEIDHDADLSQE